MSTVFRETWVLAMLPRVEPPARSARLVKSWTATPASAQTVRKMAAETASVV